MSDSEARVTIYGSSVSGSRHVKTNQQEIENILRAHKIPFKFVDVAADETAMKYMKRKNLNEKELPQIFVDGEYKGIYQHFEEANEQKKLVEFLGLDNTDDF